jgi:uncharacterized protein (DUF433 family)
MQRIVCNPQIMAGKPIIKGTRLTVEYILSMLAQDTSIDEILQEYKGIERADVLACLTYAQNLIKETLLFNFTNAA